MNKNKSKSNIILGALAVCGLFALAYAVVRTIVDIVALVERLVQKRRESLEYADEEKILQMHREALAQTN